MIPVFPGSVASGMGVKREYKNKKRLSQINFEMAFFVSAKKSGKS